MQISMYICNLYREVVTRCLPCLIYVLSKKRKVHALPFLCVCVPIYEFLKLKKIENVVSAQIEVYVIALHVA